jgi:HEAT repeats
MQRQQTVRLVILMGLALGWAPGIQAFAAHSPADADFSYAGAEGLAPESKRLGRAKDYIADEQWARAIEELRAAVADPREPRRDEALYWLAHSLNQSGDQASSVETIGRLEREFPSSIWVKPARSLRIEIAVRLNRSDVLWWTALPPPAPRAPVAVTPPESRRTPKMPPVPLPPPAIWYPDKYDPDADLRIQALGGLMKTDAEKVVPILGQIAFESENPGPAIRAVFMLAQSSLPTARATVVRVAMTAPEPVRLAAVRDLGRFGGPEASKELLSLYTTANEPVKLQIVKSLGERAETLALVRIVESEKDGTLRFSAIAGLGQAGGVAQLARMYKSASLQGKRPIIVGLFTARADVELIRIAEAERDVELRKEALERLRLLGTAKAKEYLQKAGEKR